MTKSEYQQYLWGLHWRRLRMKLYRQTQNYTCEICGAPLCLNGWEVHHWNYMNIPKEKREDLSVLCKPCHSGVHQLLVGDDEDVDNDRYFFVKEEGESLTSAKVKEINFDDFVLTVMNKIFEATGKYPC